MTTLNARELRIVYWAIADMIENLRTDCYINTTTDPLVNHIHALVVRELNEKLPPPPETPSDQ